MPSRGRARRGIFIPCSDKGPDPIRTAAQADYQGILMSAVASSIVAKHDIVETALASGHFSTFFKAIQIAELTGAFKGRSLLTVFAPTDGAFRKLPEGVLDAILKDKAKLASLIKSHVLPSKLMSQDMTTRQSKTLEGNMLNVVSENGMVSVNDAKVTKADILSTNGVIHAIDSVVVPVA
jgi:uncharacterized surface protein with fasciclin (FAS1) repeats